jgi:dihydropteroate synthase
MIWHCGDFQLQLGKRTLLMGIVNATPDSFSGDGISGEAAIQRAQQMIAEGADILDIGGESTRPGAEVVNAEEEIARVLPLIEALTPLGVPLSVDTTKAAVARAALDAGASIINDISGAIADQAMLPTLAQSTCGIVVMHRRGTPQNTGFSRATADAIHLQSELLDFFTERLIAFEQAKIARNRLCLDAGFGFGKSVEENLEIVRRGRELLPFDLPILSALSRKSTIGKILGDAPANERVFGTAALSALAIASGTDIMRVHDVKAMRDVARATDATLRV